MGGVSPKVPLSLLQVYASLGWTANQSAGQEMEEDQCCQSIQGVCIGCHSELTGRGGGILCSFLDTYYSFPIL